MKNLDTSAMCAIEIGSIAVGYRVLGALTREKDIRVLEASPLGSRFLILALGKAEVLKRASHDARVALDGSHDLIIESETIESVSPQVAEAPFSLAQRPLDESLVVVECSTVTGLLIAAQTLVAGHGLNAIEMRIHRALTGGAHGFFTGKTSACASAAEDVRTILRTTLREGRVEVIDEPSDSFREFFNFSGKA